MTRDIAPWKRRRRNTALGRDADNSITEFHRRMDNLFDDFLTGFGITRWPMTDADKVIMTPTMDVSETEDEITVSADLPGMDEKDIQVTLDNGVLTLRGEKKRESEEKKRNYHLVERSYGEFYRAIPLPSEIDADKVSARFKKGVLTVSIPKAASEKKSEKKINITTD